MLYRIAIASAVLALGACGREAPQPVSGLDSKAELSTVTAERVAGGVRITNGSGAAIKYLVVNPMWLGLLGSCAAEQAQCPQVGSGAAVTVTDDRIYGFSADARQLVVRYWVSGVTNADGTEITVVF